MRFHIPLALAATASIAAFAPTASAADPVCVGTGGDGKNPFRSSACAEVRVTDGSGNVDPRVWVGCTLLAGRAECAIKPIEPVS